ncbi:unnamed protein product [Mytilus coruscus]|uniref:KASH domain-containing protein n=1 Tax=Mytilus coruscus TaxID=42192 RepID=A0A6J8EWH8_MYTCO|nr:unnamed protein product [Mytilus coruscus]
MSTTPLRKVDKMSSQSQLNFSPVESGRTNSPALMERNNISSPDFKGILDFPSEPKRRRIMMDDVSITSSQVSSQVSSRAHSPCFSELMDESFQSTPGTTPGTSPAATLKDQFRRRYSKYELLTDNFQYLFDKDILDACKTSDEETSGENNKVSLTEFRKQYHELTTWLAQVLQTTQKSTGSLMLSEKYLVQKDQEELLNQSPRLRLINDYAQQLVERHPGFKEEVTPCLQHLHQQWKVVEEAVSCKDISRNTDCMIADMQQDLKSLAQWLDEVEQKLFSLTLHSNTNDEEVLHLLQIHQVLQKDIESRSRNINAVLKLSERLQDELEEDISLLQHSQAAQQIQRRWHGVWLQSLESQCRLENALKAKKKPFSSASFLSGWIPQNSGWEKFGSSPLTDDSFTLNNRCADFVESPLAEDSDQKDSSTCVEETDINCGLSHASGDFSGKDSAVVSEVEFKMSSECSDSDLDMLRKNKHRLESRDIGYSSGTSVSPINAGHTSTESDCDDIRKLIEKVDTLVGEKIPASENKSPKRERRSPVKRKSESPPKINEISSCDASSEDSDEGADEFSTATDEQEILCDSVLGLDFNSDASLSPTTLPRFHDTSKLKKRKQRKDRPWSVIQFSDVSDKEVVTLSKSETSINTLEYETPKQFSSSTLPKCGVKRKLYDTTLRGEVTDTETEVSDAYVTAQTDISCTEDDDPLNSTASMSEPVWWDNYHQQTVYTSLGEDQEELPISWAQLEQDLEFDEEITSAQSSSIVRDVMAKKKSKPKLVTQSSKHGYDSDSDLEDLYFFIKDSAKQLKITDQFLKKKVKDFQGTGIDLNSSKYAEVIATCQTNIDCLRRVLQHLGTVVSTDEEEDVDTLQEILYQWEKLHAFASERQLQSQQLSTLYKCLDDIQSKFNGCDVITHHHKFSSIREVEQCLSDVKEKHETMLQTKDMFYHLEDKISVYELEHPSINLDQLLFQTKLAGQTMSERSQRLSQEMAKLEHIHEIWQDYSKTRQDLEKLLQEQFNVEVLASRLQSEEDQSEDLCLQMINEALKSYEEKSQKLQVLRGQLSNYLNEDTRSQMMNSMADIHDQLFEAQRKCGQLLRTINQDLAAQLEKNSGRTSSAASSLFSSPSTWLKSRYIQAAAVFLMFGIGYILNPETVTELGNWSLSITPDLKYVNGPPPI